jgi:hypothetical protein
MLETTWVIPTITNLGRVYNKGTFPVKLYDFGQDAYLRTP